MLTELHTFANRPENVREVFLISFHDHRPNMETNPNGNCNPTIGRAVRQTLCQNLTKCPAVYQSSGSSAQWLSLAEMLRQGQRYVIVSDGRTGFSYLKSYEVSYQQESNLKQARKFVIIGTIIRISPLTAERCKVLFQWILAEEGWEMLYLSEGCVPVKYLLIAQMQFCVKIGDTQQTLASFPFWSLLAEQRG